MAARGLCRPLEAAPAPQETTRFVLAPKDVAVIASKGGGDGQPEAFAFGRAAIRPRRQRVDGGVRTGAVLARRFARHALRRHLSLSSHIVQLPRWCNQVTALHLDVASHCFNTNPLPGGVDPVRNINKDANHCDKVS